MFILTQTQVPFYGYSIIKCKSSSYSMLYVLNIDLLSQDNNQMYQQSKEKLLPSKQQTKAPQMSEWKIFFSLLITFERNYQTAMLDISPDKAINDSYVVSKVPGYRKYQLIFLYYLRKYGIFRSFLITLAFPLPFTILFYALSGYLQHLEINNQLEIVLIGLRCSVISYLCRYCLHFPEERLNWIIYIVSIICAIISNNSTNTFITDYIFVIIYFLGIFMSYFKSQDIRTRSSLVRDSKEQKQLSQEIVKLDIPHIERKQLYVVALILFFIICWIVQRMYAHSNNHYYLIEIFIVSLFNTNQEISSFYPGLYSHITHNTNIYTANIYSLGYLLPGLHLKTFFLLFQSEDLSFLVFSYFAIHLPSLLVLCISLGYKNIFFSLGWKKINLSIQAVSNGLVLVTVINLLNQQTCHWNITFFTSLVIFTVTKLYKFNEIISACLGIFLVASRASVLHFTNKKSLPDFLCKTQ